MRNDKKFTRALIIACLGLCGAFGLHEVVAAQAKPSRQEAGTSTQVGKSRWEYCAVMTGVGSVKTDGRIYGNATICYFQQGNSPCESITVEYKGAGGADWDDAALNATSSVVAKLGQEGWEMVGAGGAEAFAARGGASALYFKRAKS